MNIRATLVPILFVLAFSTGALTAHADARPVLTITANNATTTWGDAFPELTLSYAGFIDADEDGEVDDENYLDTLIVARTNATAESPAGVYEIWPGEPEAPGDFNPLEALTDSVYDIVTVNGTLTILKADQEIEEIEEFEPFTSNPFSTRSYTESDFDLSAITSSGLPASFSASGACSLTGATVKLVQNGVCTLTASQTGNGNWNPATSVVREFEVTGVPTEEVVVRRSGGGGGGARVKAPTGRVLGASLYYFANDLTIESEGPDVMELQKVLIKAGHLKIALPTGYFGPMTQAAVMLYQGTKGIPTTGYVGPLTRASLNKGVTTKTPEEQILELTAQLKALQALQAAQ